MQAQMDAQSKQMQAQAQLTLHSRQQVEALEAQLQAKMDAVAFKAVHSMTKLDSGTPNARYLVLAFAHDVPMVQQLLVHLTAAGMRAEFHDSVAPSSPSPWAKVGTGSSKSKAAKNSKLAGQAQAALSKAIAKAGPAGTVKRVHG
jgi:hypothetical protein